MKDNRPAIPAEIRRAVLIEACHRCAVCGTPTPLEGAHIVPWRIHKEHTAANLICLCANCHERSHKESWGQKTLHEYKRRPWVLRQNGTSIESSHLGALTLTTPPRPWVTIDSYSAELVEDETGQEDLWERVRVINRGQAPAVSIVIPEIHIASRRAGLLRPLPTLGPGEDINATIQGLRQTLQWGFRKAPTSSIGSTRSLRIPLVIEYHDLDHKRWTTEHAISYSVWGINFAIVHPDEPQEWTDLSSLGGQTASAR